MTYVDDCAICGAPLADDAEHDHSADAVVIRDGARGQYLAPTFAEDVHALTGAVPSDVLHAAAQWIGSAELGAVSEPTAEDVELVQDFATYGGPSALADADYVDVWDDGYVIFRRARRAAAEDGDR